MVSFNLDPRGGNNSKLGTWFSTFYFFRIFCSFHFVAIYPNWVIIVVCVVKPFLLLFGLNFKVNAVVREIVIVKELSLEPVVSRPKERMMGSPRNSAGKGCVHVFYRFLSVLNCSRNFDPSVVKVKVLPRSAAPRNRSVYVCLPRSRTCWVMCFMVHTLESFFFVWMFELWLTLFSSNVVIVDEQRCKGTAGEDGEEIGPAGRRGWCSRWKQKVGNNFNIDLEFEMLVFVF